MANTVVQSKSQTFILFGSSTGSLAYNGAVTPGSLLVAVVSYDAAVATATVQDPTNGFWTEDVTSSPTYVANGYAKIYSVQNSGNTALTVTLTTSSNAYGHLVIYEVSGAATSNALDAIGSNQGVSPVSASVTTTAANDSIFAVLINYGSTAGKVDTGYTLTIDVAGMSTYYNSTEYKEDVGAAATNTLTFNNETTGDASFWSFSLAAYKTASGGGGGGQVPSNIRRTIIW